MGGDTNPILNFWNIHLFVFHLMHTWKSDQTLITMMRIITIMRCSRFISSLHEDKS